MPSFHQQLLHRVYERPPLVVKVTVPSATTLNTFTKTSSDTSGDEVLVALVAVMLVLVRYSL